VISLDGPSKFQLQNSSETYAHIEEEICQAVSIFEDISEANHSVHIVLGLYAMLFRDFENTPDDGNAAWINFGFCQCRSDEFKLEMASAYKKIAQVASLADVMRAWEQSRINKLLLAHDIDISRFTANGIKFGRPDPDDMVIYRLMAEVHHFLAGVFCQCGSRVDFQQYMDRDTRIGRESDGNYGFHLTNAWERWNLVLLY
jgi:hypothetical protein